MKRIGLTGGIGSGKSTIAKVFEALDIPIYLADDRSKELLNTSETLKTELMHAFGKGIYSKGMIQRDVFARLLFGDTRKVLQANQIIHPFVRNDFVAWAVQQNAPYVIMEAAILFETEGFKSMDATVLVTAPEKLRLQRIMQRDRTELAAIRNRMKHQWKDDEKIPLADYVIVNDEKEPVLPQVLMIDKKLRKR
jgi:dephospho-CoA kinase